MSGMAEIAWRDKRPALTDDDTSLITRMVHNCPAIAPVLIAGECLFDTLGSIALAEITVANRYMTERLQCEPLFVLTERHTVRMARFASHSVVAAFFSLPQANAIHAMEISRLGLKKTPLSVTDASFYRAALAANRLNGSYIAENTLWAEYVNACLVFGKPWHMDIAPESFFCSFEFCSRHKLKKLAERQRKEAREAGNESVMGLTNDEVSFLKKLARDA